MSVDQITKDSASTDGYRPCKDTVLEALVQILQLEQILGSISDRITIYDLLYTIYRLSWLWCDILLSAAAAMITEDKSSLY